ncbi:MAG: ferrous iron transport protein A [Methanotrichaceae archaeon]|nr:ferrous iron transport protein A [Methanotrichaceae archaeon]
MEIPITSLSAGTEAVVVTLLGHGCTFQRRLRTMGIREGKSLKVVAIHPLAGPLVIEVDGRQITIGRGIAQRIMVQVK